MFLRGKMHLLAVLLLRFSNLRGHLGISGVVERNVFDVCNFVMKNVYVRKRVLSFEEKMAALRYQS
jgi:hypothetical protein